jgi:hypothetical protein
LAYLVDISSPASGVPDVLLQVGALDIEPVTDDLAAIIPHSVRPDSVAHTLDGARVTASAAPLNALRFSDSNRFGSGHHRMTALCVLKSDKTDLPVLWIAKSRDATQQYPF